MNNSSETKTTYYSYVEYLKQQPYCYFEDPDNNQNDMMCVTYSQKFFSDNIDMEFKDIVLRMLLKYFETKLKIDSLGLIFESIPVSTLGDDPKKEMTYILLNELKKHDLEPWGVAMELIAEYLKELDT